MSSIPFVIGITGHRDLRVCDIPQLTQQIRAQFASWMRLCPHTDFYCMTSLAEGADQLCGSIARELGMRLIVPLPMQQAEFEQDFSGSAREAFFNLLNNASEAFVAPDIEQQDDGSRDYGYRKAGIYVARHCHVLLALWDGLPGGSGCCGTAETVEFKTLKRYHAPDSFVNTPGEGIALQLVTPRASSQLPPESPLAWRYAGGTAEELLLLLKRTEAFNRDAQKADESRSCGVFEEQAARRIGPAAEQIQRVYVRADALALSYRDRYLNSIRWLSAIGALLVASFLFYDEIESNLFLLVYGLLALTALAVFWVARRGGIHQRYIEYRLFAETLRVQLNLYASGLPISVDDLASWSQRTSCPWIQAAVNALSLRAVLLEDSEIDIRAVWMQKQLDYQKTAYEVNRAKQTRQSRIAFALLVSTILFFIAVVALEFAFPLWIAREITLPAWFCRLFQTHDAHFFSARSIFKILLGIIPAFTFVVTSYYGKLSLSRKLKDGERMIALYTQAITVYDDPRTDRKRLLNELAKEELAETGGWFSYISENTPDILL